MGVVAFKFTRDNLDNSYAVAFISNVEFEVALLENFERTDSNETFSFAADGSDEYILTGITTLNLNPPQKGCGGSVAVSLLGVVTLFTCLFVFKKRKQLL